MKETNYLLQTYEIFLKLIYLKLLQENLNNEIIGFTDKTGEEESVYYTITDIHGSITEVYDGSSNLVWKSGYTAFGVIAGETVDLIDFDGMYTGCDYDAETGLTYHWNRWRNEDGSAFISEDPARDGSNWYGYAGCNPMVYVDRIGLFASNGFLGPYAAEQYNTTPEVGPQPNPNATPQNQTPNISATPDHVAGFSEQRGSYNILPKYKGIETGDKWYNSFVEGIVNYGIIGTYNLCATAINTISNGVGAAYDLINAASETVLGGDLDAITMTMMSNGMLAPAGYMLNGFNSYMNGLKLSNTSKLGNAALNLGQGVVNTGASLVGVESAATKAAKWQGKGAYPGVDNWTNVTIKKGSYVWGGIPGQSEFYTTTADIMSSGNDATKIFQGLQVGKGKYPLYRESMACYFVPYNMDIAISQALANPFGPDGSFYGNGGFTQLFIPNYKDLQLVDVMKLTNR